MLVFKPLRVVNLHMSCTVCSEAVSVEYIKSLSLQSHVIFSHANLSSPMQLKIFTPAIAKIWII